MLLRTVVFLISGSCLLLGQSWEFGGGAGYGLFPDLNVNNGALSGSTGFESGPAATVLLGNNMSRLVGGEIRYTFSLDDMKVSSGGAKATASAQSHAIHYDVLIHATSKESPVRPFLAVGAGVKLYRGNGAEPSYQPLSNLVVLTHTHEAQPMISVGGGVKFAVSRRALLRVDFRDYTTPVPTSLLATSQGSHISGWVHDLVLLVGVSTVF